MKIIYIVCFLQKGSTLKEEYFYHHINDALSHFELFREEYSDFYSSIQLIKPDEKGRETIIMQIGNGVYNG